MPRGLLFGPFISRLINRLPKPDQRLALVSELQKKFAKILKLSKAQSRCTGGLKIGITNEQRGTSRMMQNNKKHQYQVRMIIWQILKLLLT